ncbi:23S rRNA (adenine2503-C2)-methyltransferase [Butyrivibrio hungatei DSM 14810]|uniref:Probable dual-specificity RNA methyltransferase RlmN n=1 Tax=Butyrivibrio hungatei DSM 14810 TaxID=1121132 RepID=A0A1M7RRD1_9FIRM|nr:23S rRNA (adenine(2503)-C(2))-methyltransferase RlmN [Butyrivibrio hungatei]SHN48741.1 23S rRNA (adenine2503-C2)-methyltransferase [Butyrivibrio hungatei DSM 14810]
MTKIDIKSLSLSELEDSIKELGEPKFRAKQLYEWMHVKKARSYDEMTNISKSLKEKCIEHYDYTALQVVDVQKSKIDGTQKFLFGLSDGNVIESVFMRYKFGNSVCISSQVGCRMGCRFCASTIDGVVRNLGPSEMLDQIYAISRETGEKISRVVVMGSGEPLDNYDNLLKFIKLLTDENGMNMGQRNLTVSTCGIVPNIYRLADEELSINLALSLHASNNEKRKKLMPIAEKYSIDEVLDACRAYFDKTGRQLTFEYSLVSGVNDTDEDAAELSKLLEGINAVVNLIPVNPIKERDFKPTDRSGALAFKNKLEKSRINVTIRREMGRDIDGACGQLRRRHLQQEM